jgi:hypothetical protein
MSWIARTVQTTGKTKKISPDKYVFEMFNDGIQSMEITYTRN